MNWHRRILASMTMACFGFTGTAMAGPSFTDVIGQLIGASEGPRILLDHCAQVAPETRNANTVAFEAWRQRNAAMLARVQKQRELADSRILREAGKNPTVPRSVDDLFAMVKGVVDASFRTMGPEAERQMCGDYPGFLAKTEDGRLAEMGGLLDLIEHSQGVADWGTPAAEPAQRP